MRKRWAGLDGLRGCAVVAVVLFHLDLLHCGFLGVDVFFVLSGFLITGLVQAEFVRSGSVSLARFYLRRSFRLYPALLALAAFCVGVAAAGRGDSPRVVHQAIAAITYTTNLFTPDTALLDHTWTLALEEQFYLCWPALFLFARSRKSSWGFAPALAVVVAILAADLAHGQSGPLHTYVRAMGLPLGCALGLAKPGCLRFLARFGWPAIAALVLLMALPSPLWLTTGWPVSAGAVLAVFIVAMLSVRPIMLFESNVLCWFGLRSYSLYLWHFPLIMLAWHRAPASIPLVLRLAAAVVASVVAADLSFRLIEQPMLRCRDRWVRPGSAVPAPRHASHPARRVSDHRHAA